MPRLIVHGFTLSLDGYGADPSKQSRGGDEDDAIIH